MVTKDRKDDKKEDKSDNDQPELTQGERAPQSQQSAGPERAPQSQQSAGSAPGSTSSRTDDERKLGAEVVGRKQKR